MFGRGINFKSNTARVQREVVNYLFRLEQLTRQFTFSQRQKRRHKTFCSRHSNTRKGIRTNRSDIILWLRGGKSLHIEVKTNQDWITQCERDRHEKLKELEHKICLIRAQSPKDGVEQMMAILKENGVKTL